MPRIKGGGVRPEPATPQRLQDAAALLLAAEGFAAATTRAIGEAAGCNPALVSYYYGSLNALLLAALDASSAARLARYEEAIDHAANRRALIAALRELYQEDRRCGHAALLAALVAGGGLDRELGRAVAVRVQPWVDLVERTVRARTPAPLRRRMPAREVGYAAVAAFLGLELLDALMGDKAQGDIVLDRLAGLATRRGGKA